MGLRDSFSWVTGDEGTYMAMAESLARDGDLIFDARDRERIEAASTPGEKQLILQRTHLGITYSKPVLYAVLAAPFQWLFGAWGPVALNLLAAAGALWLTYLYLRRLGPDGDYLTLLTFAGTSAMPAYLAWRMSDSVLVSFTLAGLVLALASARKPRRRFVDSEHLLDGRWPPLFGGVLLGMASFMRYPNALLAVMALIALLALRRWNRAATYLAGLAAGTIATVILTVALIGTPDPYRAPRATFNPTVGLPDGPDSPVVEQQLGGLQRASVWLNPEPQPRVVAYSTFYFLVGRHTGLLLYFPAALILVWLALRRPDAVSWAMLLGVAGVALFYLVLLPHNYFGGGAAIGNRYFMATYPALLIALRELPRGRSWITAWLVAAAVLGSSLASAWQTRDARRTSQAHAHAGLFRLLPYESTLQSIEGSRERFWLHDWEWEMLRFNDPFSRVGSFSFFLDTGSPPAEIEIANTDPQRPLRFLVLSGAPELRVDYSDWRRSETFELQRPSGERGVIEVQPSSSWRRHPFWFHWRRNDVFYPKLVRLGVRTPDGSPATAEVRYLGSADIPREIYSREVIDSELPTVAGTGTRSLATVAVLNTSQEIWKSDRVLSVFLSYRLFYRTDQGLQVIEGGRTPLPEPVAPGETLRSEIEIRWPSTPRGYGLAIDLVHEGISWFEDRVGAPIARSEVNVISLPKAEPLQPKEEAASDARPTQ